MKLSIYLFIYQPYCPVVGRSLSMFFPSLPILCCSLPGGFIPILIQVVSPSFCWSSSKSLPSVRSPGGNVLCPSVVFESADVSCPRPLHSSGCFYHVCDSCLCSHPGVCLSVMVCYIKHTPLHLSARPLVFSELVL